MKSPTNEDNDQTECIKQIEVDDIHHRLSIVWAKDEHNPDYRLVTVNAANQGFQSKMDTVSGSYVVTKLTEKISKNIKRNKLFLNEILDDIQEELHDAGKQLMVKTFNNKTGNIKFVKNKNQNGNNEFIEQEMVFTEIENGRKRSGYSPMAMDHEQ